MYPKNAKKMGGATAGNGTALSQGPLAPLEQSPEASMGNSKRGSLCGSSPGTPLNGTSTGMMTAASGGSPGRGRYDVHQHGVYPNSSGDYGVMGEALESEYHVNNGGRVSAASLKRLPQPMYQSATAAVSVQPPLPPPTYPGGVHVRTCSNSGSLTNALTLNRSVCNNSSSGNGIHDDRSRVVALPQQQPQPILVSHGGSPNRNNGGGGGGGGGGGYYHHGSGSPTSSHLPAPPYYQDGRGGSLQRVASGDATPYAPTQGCYPPPPPPPPPPQQQQQQQHSQRCGYYDPTHAPPAFQGQGQGQGQPPLSAWRDSESDPYLVQQGAYLSGSDYGNGRSLSGYWDGDASETGPGAHYMQHPPPPPPPPSSLPLSVSADRDFGSPPSYHQQPLAAVPPTQQHQPQQCFQGLRPSQQPPPPPAAASPTPSVCVRSPPPPPPQQQQQRKEGEEEKPERSAASGDARTATPPPQDDDRHAHLLGQFNEANRAKTRLAHENKEMKRVIQDSANELSYYRHRELQSVMEKQALRAAFAKDIGTLLTVVDSLLTQLQAARSLAADPPTADEMKQQKLTLLESALLVKTDGAATAPPLPLPLLSRVLKLEFEQEGLQAVAQRPKPQPPSTVNEGRPTSALAPNTAGSEAPTAPQNGNNNNNSSGSEAVPATVVDDATAVLAQGEADNLVRCTYKKLRHFLASMDYSPMVLPWTNPAGGSDVLGSVCEGSPSSRPPSSSHVLQLTMEVPPSSLHANLSGELLSSRCLKPPPVDGAAASQIEPISSHPHSREPGGGAAATTTTTTTTVSVPRHVLESERSPSASVASASTATTSTVVRAAKAAAPPRKAKAKKNRPYGAEAISSSSTVAAAAATAASVSTAAEER